MTAECDKCKTEGESRDLTKNDNCKLSVVTKDFQEEEEVIWDLRMNKIFTTWIKKHI